MDSEKKKTNRPNNVARIPCSLSDSFFRYWFMFWEPFHKLTKREIDVAATLVKIRYELSKVVKDETLLEYVTLFEQGYRILERKCDELDEKLEEEVQNRIRLLEEQKAE